MNSEKKMTMSQVMVSQVSESKVMSQYEEEFEDYYYDDEESRYEEFSEYLQSVAGVMCPTEEEEAWYQVCCNEANTDAEINWAFVPMRPVSLPSMASEKVAPVVEETIVIAAPAPIPVPIEKKAQPVVLSDEQLKINALKDAFLKVVTVDEKHLICDAVFADLLEKKNGDDFAVFNTINQYIAHRRSSNPKKVVATPSKAPVVSEVHTQIVEKNIHDLTHNDWKLMQGYGGSLVTYKLTNEVRAPVVPVIPFVEKKVVSLMRPAAGACTPAVSAVPKKDEEDHSEGKRRPRFLQNSGDKSATPTAQQKSVASQIKTERGERKGERRRAVAAKGEATVSSKVDMENVINSLMIDSGMTIIQAQSVRSLQLAVVSELKANIEKKRVEEQEKRFLQSLKMEVILITPASETTTVVKTKTTATQRVKKSRGTRLEIGDIEVVKSYENVKKIEKVDDAVKYEKTTMCRLVYKTGKCPRAVCTFAHSISELTPFPCKFSSDCKLFNDECQDCNHFHPSSETKESYCARRAITEPTKPSVGEIMMKKMGWKNGNGLGSKDQGVVEPVTLDSQSTKRGLGYYELPATQVCDIADSSSFWSRKTEQLRQDAKSNPSLIGKSEIPVAKPVVEITVEEVKFTPSPSDLKKTKMCTYVLNGGSCPRAVCTFAHSLSELTAPKCNHDSSCRHMHNQERPCIFIHSNESKTEWLARSRVYPNFVEKKVAVVAPKVEAIVAPKVEAIVAPKVEAIVAPKVEAIVAPKVEAIVAPSPSDLKKTKMCTYVLNGGSCPRAVCTFAHSLSELTAPKCNHDSSCRHMHNQERPCIFIHSNESKTEWLARSRVYPNFVEKKVAVVEKKVAVVAPKVEAVVAPKVEAVVAPKVEAVVAPKVVEKKVAVVAPKVEAVVAPKPAFKFTMPLTKSVATPAPVKSTSLREKFDNLLRDMMENPVYTEPVSNYIPGEVILLTPEVADEKSVVKSTKPFSFSMSKNSEGPKPREVTIRVPAGSMADAIKLRDMLGLNNDSVVISITN